MQEHSPLIRECLEALYSITELSLQDHREVFAVRFDLRFPEWGEPSTWSSNRVMTRFVESLQERIQQARSRAARVRGRAHATTVRWMWVREYGRESGYSKPHYHGVLLLNRDAFNTLGAYELERDNLYSRLVKAWASALGVVDWQAQGLVHIPANACYCITAEDYSEYFHRMSYLCKSKSKVYGDGQHAYGSSKE